MHALAHWNIFEKTESKSLSQQKKLVHLPFDDMGLLRNGSNDKSILMRNIKQKNTILTQLVPFLIYFVTIDLVFDSSCNNDVLSKRRWTCFTTTKSKLLKSVKVEGKYNVHSLDFRMNQKNKHMYKEKEIEMVKIGPIKYIR